MPSTQQKFFVDNAGNYLGSWTGFKHEDKLAFDRDGDLILINGEPFVLETGAEILPTPPAGAIEVPAPPGDGRDKWDGTKWIPAAPAKRAMTTDDVVRALLKRGVINAADLEDT